VEPSNVRLVRILLRRGTAARLAQSGIFLKMSKHTWLSVAQDSDFSIENLPYGIFSAQEKSKRAGIAIGSFVLDLSELQSAGVLPQEIPNGIFDEPYLNEFIAHPTNIHQTTREAIQELLNDTNTLLRDNVGLCERVVIPIDSVRLHMPVHVGNFVDFYSSEQHATNVGRMFRPDNPLMPNWKHMPIAYNGRASSLVVSGTSVRRPKGQTMPEGADSPVFGPSKRLDFELEVGFITRINSTLGEPVSIESAREAIFGLVLVNDWSARDLQKWEYQPLGPFLGKSFATTISPWVVTLEALEPWLTQPPQQIPKPLPYLQSKEPWALDLELEVELLTEKSKTPQCITHTNFKNMYWTFDQQLAHATVNGANVCVGDLFASGTVSGDFWDGEGEVPNTLGSLLEMTWGGKHPIKIKETGEERRFIEDGDTVTLKGWCQGDGYRVGFGQATAKVLAALN
jgi:fumarylacetoacetase